MPITPNPNSFLAGYNAQRANEAELAALEQEPEKNSLLMDKYRAEAEAKRASAPLEAAKLQQEYALRQQELQAGDLEQEQKEAEFIAQRVGPVIKGWRAGDIDEQAAMGFLNQLKANLPFDVDPAILEELDAGGLDAYEMLVNQAQSLAEQNKPPPKPYAAQMGDQTVYLDPYTGQPVPGLGGPKFAPPRPQQPKTQIKFDDQGNPLAVAKIGPDGSFVIEKFPTAGDELMDQPTPARSEAAIDQATKYGAGPYKALGEAYDNTVNALLGRASNTKRDEARNWLRRARQVTAALNGVPGRPTNYMVQMATSYLADTKAFQNPETARTNLLMAVDALERGYEEAVANYNAAPSKTVKGRYFEEVADIRAALRTLSTPAVSGEGKVERKSGSRPPLSSFDKR